MGQTTLKPSTDNDAVKWQSIAAGWQSALQSLVEEVRLWISQEPGWTFEGIGQEEIEEPRLGRYPISVWSIHTPEGEVRLEPIARNYPGYGIVELYAWPTLRRVHLLRGEENGQWKVRVDSGFNLHQPWDRDHFLTLVQDLIGAEDLIAVECY